MAIALFVLGHAGSGKTQFSKKFIKSRLKDKKPWCLLDKDVSGEKLSTALMIAYGLDPNDKDSPEYKQKVRDLEYRTCLDVARDQLRLGINVVMPGPWTKELNNGELFDVKSLDLPKKTKLIHVYLDVPVDKLKQRIIERKKGRDGWKLLNWEEFSKTLVMPSAIKEHGVSIITHDMEFAQQEKIILELFD